MAMVVKNNMSAVRTLNTLNSNSNALQGSLAKVSSGMKINSAQDDASGYAISERMRVQIRSLDQANQNTQNGSSLMKTAEGAVSKTVEILKSLKEKAISAATDTNTDSDRVTIQKEIDQFIDQIDDNALVTFNGKYLVDGSKTQSGLATKTTMTNQSLATDTSGTTVLTNLANRNNESLEITSSDYVTASFVKDGKTFTTKFQVGDTDGNVTTLNDVFAKLDTQYSIDMTGQTTNTGVIGTAPLSWDTDSGTIIGNAVKYLTETVSANDLDAYLTNVATTVTNTDDKIAQALALAKQDTAQLTTAINNATTAATAGVKAVLDTVDTATQTFTATLAAGDAVINDSNGDTNTAAVDLTVKIDTAAAGTTGDSSGLSQSIETSSVKVTYSTTPADSGKTLADGSATIATEIVTKVKTAATNAATDDGNYNTGDVGNAVSAADTVGLQAAYVGDGHETSTRHVGPLAAGTIDVSLSTNAVTDTSLDELGKAIVANAIVSSANYTADDAVLAAAKAGDFAKSTDYIKSSANVGTNAAGGTVTTANGEVGLTMTAGDSGLAGQISGLAISVSDSEGNVKKSANASLDAFSTTIFAANRSDDNALKFHVGATANLSITVGLADMRSEALGLKGSDGSKVSVATQSKANAAIATFDNALQKALDIQTTIGAVEARLDYTSSNLTTSSENVQAAESTIRDADMAKEMTNYTKNNVLLQAAQSMLAQANQNSSAVLSLLQ